MKNHRTNDLNFSLFAMVFQFRRNAYTLLNDKLFLTIALMPYCHTVKCMTETLRLRVIFRYCMKNMKMVSWQIAFDLPSKIVTHLQMKKQLPCTALYSNQVIHVVRKQLL